jgi:transposase-like protein
MQDDKVIGLRQPGEIDDPLSEIVRQGARSLLMQAVEAEVSTFLEDHSDASLADGRRRFVRHGHLPDRMIQTGIGAVEVRQPRVRDRGPSEHDGLGFSPSILPKYARRTRSLDALIPWLYLKGISSGDFQQALTALLGADAPNLSADAVLRLRKSWRQEQERWEQCDLSARRYVYLWADGIYFQARMDEASQCMLVIIGATPEGRKELVGFTDGYRESAQSWRELLVDLKARGLAIAPELAIADGGLGFWAALREIFPTTKEQRCWVHKTANVLNAMPKAVQPKAKQDLHQIWMAETRADAQAAFERFVTKYGVKYNKATQCLAKDRQVLLTFYDFPAEHWKHVRTSNPIESTFATVRHRTKRSKGCLSRATARVMVFKLIKAAERSWRKLDGQNQLPKIIEGVKFTNGVEVKNDNQAAA